MEFYDLNNPKPSQERRLLANLQEPVKSSAFLKHLARYLSSSIEGGEAKSDRTRLAATRLTALGVWAEIDPKEMASGVEQSREDRFIAFKGGLPKALGERLYANSKYSRLKHAGHKDDERRNSTPPRAGYYGRRRKFTKAVGSKRDQLIELYASDLREKCGMTPDMDLLTKVTIGCGHLIYDAKASVVDASQQNELEAVKETFLIKKLGLTDGPQMPR